MHQSNEHKAWPKYGKALAISAALLCATALGQPKLAYAGHGGGGGGGFHGGGFGGFHGGGMGGFHGGFAGMHGGGFGGFHGGGFHEGGFHGGRFHGDRFRDNRFFFGGAFAYPYGGITLQTMAIMITASPMPRRLGTIATILPDITLM